MASFDPTQRTLSSIVPERTAGSLPSCRTESLLTNALASDDINEVKGNLAHIWAHYQSLELLLSDRAGNSATLATAKEEIPIHDIDDADLALGYFATGAIEVAYAVAHQFNDVIEAGLADTVPEAMRVLYPRLDYSDPERPTVTDDPVAQFLRELANSQVEPLDQDDDD